MTSGNHPLKPRLAAMLVIAALPIFAASASTSLTSLSAGAPGSAIAFGSTIGINVNPHLTDEDADGLARLGVKWVRVGIDWEGIERGAPGTYRFDLIDPILERLDKKRIGVMAILCYNHAGLYAKGCKHCAVRTPEGLKAFGRFAKATADHVRRRFPGLPVMYEVWNEPDNGSNWEPRADAKEYVALARSVSRYIGGLPWGRGLRPAIVGPAVSNVNRPGMEFLEDCLQAGLADWVDAVSVHCYRHDIPGDSKPRPPESVGVQFQRIREMIGKAGADLPIISGEWGYCAIPDSVKPSNPEQYLSEPDQARFLTRMWLYNAYQGVPLSIWYEWHDADARHARHWSGNMGLKTKRRHKQALLAGSVLTRAFGQAAFSERLSAPSPDRYLLRFHDAVTGLDHLACWKVSDGTDTALVEAIKTGTYRTLTMLGGEGRLTATSAGLAVPLSASPFYILGIPGR